MSEAKDADVDRLTAEQLVFRLDIWRKLHSHWLPDEADRQLMDLREHLQSLSQAAVRDEALEEAAKVCDAIAFSRECADDTMQGVYDARPYKQCALTIRALKREPNAAPTREESRQDWDAVLSVGPAPAAPDVARMVKRLRDYRCADPWAGSLMIEAAALLAKLGQGWVPETVIEIDEDGKVHPEGVKLKNLRPGASDE